MPQGGYLEQKPRSPTGLAIVIVAHVAVLSALALSKMEVPVPQFLGPLKIRNIELPKDPPPLPPESKVEPREVPQHKTVITRPDPIVKTQTESVFELTRQEPVELTWVNTKPGPIDIPRVEPPPRPLPDPVRMEARLDPRSELLPPYPAEEERAASDAFWRETHRHALRNWRFKPATLDGKPVESVKTMTVRFVLDS